MSRNTQPVLTRRETLERLGAVAGAGIIGLGTSAARAEGPPETTKIRLMYDRQIPVLCYGPMILAEDFLRLEGFTEITYEGYGNAINDAQVLVEDRADFAASLGSDLVVTIDKGGPIVTLTGLHAGCVEVFASNAVNDIRDLAGKRLLATGLGGPEHVFLSGIVAFVGLDPARDVTWVWEADYSKWPDLLEHGKVDVVNAFPPQNLELHERRVGHVILNTTVDDPWRNFFCCLVAGRSDFVRRNPVATKRAVRAFVKANQLCEFEQESTAKRLVELGAIDRYDFALKTLQDVPYGAWRNFDPRDTLRFLSLRLREARLIQSAPNQILANGTDFKFLEEIRREMKT